MAGAPEDGEHVEELRIGRWLPPAPTTGGPASTGPMSPDGPDTPTDAWERSGTGGPGPGGRHRAERPRADHPIAAVLHPAEADAPGPVDADPPAQPTSRRFRGRASVVTLGNTAPTTRRRRALLLAAAVATVATATGVPVLLLSTMTGTPPDQQVLPPAPLVEESAVERVTPQSSTAVSPTAAATARPSGTPGGTPSPLRPSLRATTPGGTPTSADGPAPLLVQTLSLEAEGSDAVRVGLAMTRQHGGASSGMVVTAIGNGLGLVRFPNVTVATAGEYELTVHYTSGTDRYATVTCNGQRHTVGFPETDDEEGDIGTVTLRLALRAGTNTIEYGYQRSWAPDLDRVVLTTATAG